MKYVVVILLTLIIVTNLIIVSITVKNNQSSVQEFTYNKHQYIYFSDKGVVHNPECKKCILTFD